MTIFFECDLGLELTLTKRLTHASLTDLLGSVANW